MSERPIIRLATHRDAEVIAFESMAEIEHNMGWSWHPGRVTQAIDDPNTNVVVATDGESILGFGVMTYEEDFAHLKLFAVREGDRRRGIGSALLRWLEQVAVVGGLRQLKVEARQTNVGARAFYRHHGYSESEVVPSMYQGSEAGVRFTKAIGVAVKEA